MFAICLCLTWEIELINGKIPLPCGTFSHENAIPRTKPQNRQYTGFPFLVFLWGGMAPARGNS
jgi:hypothetical protein